MDEETYSILMKKALDVFEYDLPLDPDECAMESIDFDALSSLVNQISVRSFKKAARKQNPRLGEAIISRLKQEKGLSSAGVSNSCFDIAQRFRVNGYKMAKMIVEAKYGKASKGNKNRGKSNYNANNDGNSNVGNNSNGTFTVQQILTESPNAFEEDQELLGEILQCMCFDKYHAHPIELLKETVGKEYEEYLTDCLKHHGMCFETEAELRNQGKPKTPDILFLIPMAIRKDSVHKSYHNSNSSSLAFTATTTNATSNMTQYQDISESRRGYGDNNSNEIDNDNDNNQLNYLSPPGFSSPNPNHNHNHNLGSPYMDDISMINSATSTPQNPSPSPSPGPGLGFGPGLGDHSPSMQLQLQLQLPLQRTRSNSEHYKEEYVIVNWIDSKALFADHETFEEHYEQLKGYVNRYGRGLVIYWHGYADSIRNSDRYMSTDGMILLADTFPKDWLSPVQDQHQHQHSYSNIDADTNNNREHGDF